MKRIIISCLVICFAVTLFGCGKGDTDEATDNYIHIAENVYFENVFGDYQSIFYLENEEKSYIEKDTYIIKFSYDGEDTIAYHANVLADDSDESTQDLPCRKKAMGGFYYSIKEDYWVIYNIATNERTKFNSQKDFVSYCNENNPYLLNFKYSNGLGVMDYDVKQISNRVKLIRFGNPFPDQMLIDNEVVFEGYISQCEAANENTIRFKIQIPDKAYFEFVDSSNLNIALSDTAVSKYKTSLLISEDIFFDGSVEYNIDTKTVRTEK